VRIEAFGSSLETSGRVAPSPSGSLFLQCVAPLRYAIVLRHTPVAHTAHCLPLYPAFQAKLDLQKELGDVLFDAFMLNAIVSRDHGLDASATFATVCAKMEGRTPYVATWGDGETVATTADEAAGVWRKVKGEEREKEGGEKEEEDKEVGSDTMPGKVTKQLKGTLGRVRSSVAATVTRNWNLLVEDRCVGVSTAVGVAVVGVVLGYLVARKGNGGSRNAAIAAAATAATLPSLPALPNLPEVFSNSNKTVNAGVAAFVDNVKAPFALVVKSVGKGVERLRGAKSE